MSLSKERMEGENRTKFKYLMFITKTNTFIDSIFLFKLNKLQRKEAEAVCELCPQLRFAASS